MSAERVIFRSTGAESEEGDVVGDLAALQPVEFEFSGLIGDHAEGVVDHERSQGHGGTGFGIDNLSRDRVEGGGILLGSGGVCGRQKEQGQGQKSQKSSHHRVI